MIYSLPGDTFTSFLIWWQGGLVGTLGVRIENPDGTTHTARTTAGIVELEPGSGLYSREGLIAPSEPGTYAVIWDDGGGATTLEPLEVTAVLPTTAPSQDLVTLNDVKLALGIPLSDSGEDAKLLQAISDAEQAIKTYTGRSFAVVEDPAPAPSARSFPIHESGVTIIDDFQHGSVSAVNLGDVAVSGYRLEPRDEDYPVGWWVETLSGWRSGSPAMGFTRNEDTLAFDGRWFPDAPEVTVTAVWGWPSVPGDVHRAALWAAIAFQDQPRSFISESIAGYSRTTANPLVEAIPPRALSLLANHVKRQT